MVVADGTIDPDELDVSTALARDLFPDLGADLLAMLRTTTHEARLPFGS